MAKQHSSKMRAPVKYAGGKYQLLPELLKYKPKKFKRYFEPFVGGGSLLLELAPIHVTINDVNKDLICLYKCLRDKRLFKKFYATCKEHEQNHSEEYYYKIRNLDRNKTAFNRFPTYAKAARFLYLNKSCFNGLYRLNSKGEFNVPFNGKEKINCFEEDNIQALHKYFNKRKPIILCKDYAIALKTAKAKDFVYIDPPYDTLKDDSFTAYSADGFDKKEQERLRDVIKELTDRGVYVMASNANTPFVQELYKDFNIHIVLARRNINSKGDGRGKVEEVIITNY